MRVDTGIWDRLLRNSTNLLAHAFHPAAWRRRLPEGVHCERYPTAYLFRCRNDILRYDRGHLQNLIIEKEAGFALGGGEK